MRTVAFVLWGYLSGSVLYAHIFANIFGKKDFIGQSKDHNPGTANAFMHGGFLCGLLTLICDIGKGFLPVFSYMRYSGYENSFGMAMCMVAPVIGHAFPIFYRLKGGKGIAVTFGCLLGILPIWKPLGILIILFLFFSVIIRVTPHYYRTIVVYLCALCGMVYSVEASMAILGFALITGVVFIRMFLSAEEKEGMRVKLLWMH